MTDSPKVLGTRNREEVLNDIDGELRLKIGEKWVPLSFVYFIEVDGEIIEEKWNKSSTEVEAVRKFHENIIAQNKIDKTKVYTIGCLKRKMFFDEKKNTWDLI